MISTQPCRRVAEELRREVDELLNSIGLLCRVFGRGKSDTSLTNKLTSTPGKYFIGGKLIQDTIGLRVVLYFPEDIPVVEEILKHNYKCDEKCSTIDKPEATTFSVTRHNLIFKLPDRWKRDIELMGKTIPVDTTFEVQIRTILSEGWHEVEHDLRYKRQQDWVGHTDLSRGLNGVVATLETAEWSMRKIFDDLAHRHYKAKRWEAMLHTALRMRTHPILSAGICNIIDKDNQIAKSLLRINRATVFRNLSKLAPKIPVTLDNIVFIWNYLRIHNNEISSATPNILKETFAASLEK